jgi:hypothetical protein
MSQMRKQRPFPGGVANGSNRPHCGLSVKASVCVAETRQPHISHRPRHLAAALLDRAGDIGAIDDARHLEEVVRFVAARLGVADIEGGDELVLARAVKGRVRREAGTEPSSQADVLTV